MATDAEWTRIQEAADAAGLTYSQYVVNCCLPGQTSTGETDTGVPPSVIRRLVRTTLVLERLEKLRLEREGAGNIWEQLVADADAWIDTETALE